MIDRDGHDVVMAGHLRPVLRRELEAFVTAPARGRLVARIHLQGARGEFRHRLRIDLATYGAKSRDFLLAA